MAVLKTGCYLAASLLTASAARAQVPALLPGRWQVYELGFVAGATVPDSIRERLNDPQVADLNKAIEQGEAQLVVEFRPNGTYEFTITHADQRTRTETGTYTVQNNQLLANSAGPEESSLHNQHLLKLTRRTLVLAFPVGSHLPGVTEEVEYRRVR